MNVMKKDNEYKIDDIPIAFDGIDFEGQYIFCVVSYRYRKLDLDD